MIEAARGLPTALRLRCGVTMADFGEYAPLIVRCTLHVPMIAFPLMRPLTTDFSKGDRRPYFLWDEDLSVDELRAKLDGQDEGERRRLLGKMLREARDIDVWHFTTPKDVAKELPHLGRRLGRRRGFWEFLIAGWREDGILEA